MRASELILHINDRIIELYKKIDLYEYFLNNRHYRPAATMAVYNDLAKEIIIIGDCRCLYKGKIHTTSSKLDEVLSNFRSLVNQLALKNGVTEKELMNHDYGREIIRPILLKKGVFLNETGNRFSYSALDGYSIPTSGIITVKIENNETSFVLASDGYPIVENSLSESETRLLALLQEDPLCIRKNISTKGLIKNALSYDDRSYLKIEIA